jgi:hypothetical protein
MRDVARIQSSYIPHPRRYTDRVIPVGPIHKIKGWKEKGKIKYLNKYSRGKCGSSVLLHGKTALGNEASYQVQDREIKETTYIK